MSQGDSASRDHIEHQKPGHGHLHVALHPADYQVGAAKTAHHPEGVHDAAHIDASAPIKPHHVEAARSRNVKEPAGAALDMHAKAGDKSAAPVEKTVVDPGKAKVAPGETPTISVQVAKPGETKEPPTFKVDKDGKVHTSDGADVKALTFPNGVPKNISIQLDRDPANASLPEAQRKAVEAKQIEGLNNFLGNDLNPALRQAGQDVNKTGSTVEDPSNLVNPKRKAEMARGEVQPEPDPVQPAPRGFSKQEAAATHHMNGRHGMPDHHRGRMSRRHADQMYPERDVPRQSGENDEVYARKEAMAASFNPDKNNPYGTIRKDDNGALEVGRYGHSFNHFNNQMNSVLHKVHWPAAVMDKLGHPPDWSKLSEILKENPDIMKDPNILKEIQAGKDEALKNGELPSSMADRFKDAKSLESYAGFVGKLKGDKGELTKEELAANLPKEAQEQMAQNTVERGIKTGASASETALAQHLGKTPDQLTPQEKTDPANKDFLSAADKYYALAHARTENGPTSTRNPNDPIEWSTMENGQVLAKAALNMARHIGTVGDCARGPRQTLEQFGFSMKPMIATEQGKTMISSGLFREVSREEARPGDYFVRDWNSEVARAHGVNKGDSGFVIERRGNTLVQANDHVQAFPEDGGRYRNTKFLRPTAEFWARYGRGQA